MRFFSVIALSAALATVANAFPKGAGTCLSNATVIAAGGGGAMGMPADLGFGITVGLKDTYTPGDNKPVSVMITGNKQFKGILVYALDKDKNHVGTWIPSAGIQFKQCQGDPKGTLTHTSPALKGPAFGMLWMAPKNNTGDIFFTASLVTGPATGFQVVKSGVFKASAKKAKATTTKSTKTTSSATPISESSTAAESTPTGAPSTEAPPAEAPPAQAPPAEGGVSFQTATIDPSLASAIATATAGALIPNLAANGADPSPTPADGGASFQTVAVDSSLSSAIATATSGSLIPNLAANEAETSPTISLTSGASSVRPVSLAIVVVAALALLL